MKNQRHRSSGKKRSFRKCSRQRAHFASRSTLPIYEQLEARTLLAADGLSASGWYSSAEVSLRSLMGSNLAHLNLSATANSSAQAATASGTPGSDAPQATPHAAPVATPATPGVASQLDITSQPTTSTSFTNFNIVVSVKDAEGGVVPTFNGEVTLNIDAGPAGAILRSEAQLGTILTGQQKVNAVNGVATFTNLLLDRSGSYTLRANSGSLTADITSNITVTPGLKVSLVAQDTTVNHAPISSVNVGQDFSLAVMVQDIRTPTQFSSGVFASWMNISYQAALASIDAHAHDPNQPDEGLVFGDGFTLLRSGSLDTPGQIIDAGGSVVSSPNSPNPQFLFRVTVHANAPGQLIFQSAISTATPDKGHDSFLAHPVIALAANQIDFGSLTLTVGSNAPEGANKTVTTLEDTSYTFSAADFPITDPGDTPPDTLLAVKIATLPATGSLTDNGVAVTAGQFISLADINGGLLKYAPASNANGAAAASFTFQVQDNGGTTGGNIDLDPTPNTITVSVTSVNDAPQGADKTVTTVEDTDVAFASTDFGFSDPTDTPANALAAVRITTLPTTGTLKNDGVAVTVGQLVTVADITAGKLKFTPAADANGANIANFTFQVQDDGGTANGGVNLDATANTMTISATAVNDAPVGTTKSISVTQNSTRTLTVADFGFTDPHDTPPNTLVAVKIATIPTAGTFTDNGEAVTAGQLIPVADITGGLLKFTPADDALGTPYASLTFQVQDNGGVANTGVDLDPTPKVLTINVVPPNHAPAGADKTVTTNEDVAYTFQINDFGFSDTADTPPNNFNAVRVSTLPATGSLTKNGVAVTAGQLVSTIDIAGGLLKFTPAANTSGASNASFTFQVQDDAGTANGGVDLDPSANTMTISVTAVNDAPQGASNTVTTLEDTALVFSTSDFGFSDPNDSPGNIFLALRVTTVPTTGSLTNNGAAVTAGQFIPVADILGGLFKFTPATDANGAANASFTFQVQDDGGVANGGVDLDASANTMTINVTSVNDAPQGADKTVSTGTNLVYTFTAADFGFTDPKDTPANALAAVKITTVPTTGQGSLTDNGTPVTAGQLVSLADITGGLLKYTPPNNATGSALATFTFQVQDNGGTTDGGVNLDPTPNTITANVVPPSHAPSGADKTLTTLEDTAHVFVVGDFGFSDAGDTPANTLQAVKVTTLPTTGSLTNNNIAVTLGQLISVADITGGLFKFTPALNANGAANSTFTFQVQDNGGTANGGADLDPSANTITFDVTSVNDPPQGTNTSLSTLEDTALTLTVANFGFSDTNDNPANTMLAVKITSLPTSGTLTDNGIAVTAGQIVTVLDIVAGLLKFTPAANANGSPIATFTFQVQDGGGTANGGIDTTTSPNTMTINVTAVNDAPQGTNTTITTPSNTARTLTAADFGFTDTNDTPANTLFAVQITTLPSQGTITNNGVAVTAGQFISLGDLTSGNLKYTPPTGSTGSPLTTFTFQVRDNGGVSNGGVDVDPTPNTITINVTVTSSTISGRVFFDGAGVAAGNGGQFTGQDPIVGTKVTLFALDENDEPVGAPQLFTIGTDEAALGLEVGQFQFTVPNPGDYNLVFIPPSDAKLLPGTAVSGSLDDEALPQQQGGAGLTIHVTAGGQSGTGYNFFTSGRSSAGVGMGSMRGNYLAGLYAAAGQSSPTAVPNSLAAPVAAPAAKAAANTANPFSQNGDTVTIHGTAGDDQFVFTAGAQNSVTLNGATRQFDSSVVNFVFDGGGGDDTATATGASGNDTAALQLGSGTLSGPGYKLTVSNVANFNVTGGGGHDTATLQDSALSDMLQANGDHLSLLNDSGLSTSLTDFAEVHAASTHGGSDTTQIGAIDFALTQEGNWAS